MTQSNKSNKHLLSVETVLPKKNLSKIPKITKAVDLDDPALFHNRELSHVKFNLRVLSQAKNNQYPILERLNFLTIFSSNLDEFYEIRVAGLKKQIATAKVNAQRAATIKAQEEIEATK